MKFTLFHKFDLDESMLRAIYFIAIDQKISRGLKLTTRTQNLASFSLIWITLVTWLQQRLI